MNHQIVATLGPSSDTESTWQIFEHMTEHPTLTRSEVCALYAALMQGLHGLVLSDETAIGRDPVESCRLAALLRP